MKNLNLENYGVQEMNEKEMMMVDGGAPIPYWKYYYSGTDNEIVYIIEAGINLGISVGNLGIWTVNLFR